MVYRIVSRILEKWPCTFPEKLALSTCLSGLSFAGLHRSMFPFYFVACPFVVMVVVVVIIVLIVVFVVVFYVFI